MFERLLSCRCRLSQTSAQREQKTLFFAATQNTKANEQMQNTEPLNIVNGGIQIAPPILSTMSPQIIYLDFDGELTRYHNRDLDINIENVEVEDSGLSEERIAEIVKVLNDDFATQNVIFVTERPEDTEYSTIFVGKTSSFDQYGKFAGLAETIDVGNAIKSDNAFVMLDATADDAAIIETISHEAQHLLGTLEHGGEGIGQYAEGGYIYYYYLNNQTYTGNLSSSYLYLSRASSERTITYSSTRDGGNIYSCIGTNYVSANNVSVNSGGRVYVSSGGVANNVSVNSDGMVYVCSGGVANDTTMNGGSLAILGGGIANNTTINLWNGGVYVRDGGIANKTIINSSGRIDIYGVANTIAVHSDGELCVWSGGTAYGITVSSGGIIIIQVAPETYIRGTSDGSAFEVKNATISNFTVNEKILLHIDSGGVANDITILSSGNGEWGRMWVRGIANNTTITRGGLIVSGGMVNATTVNSGYLSCWYYTSGGVINRTIVNANGRVYVTVGDTANSTTVNSGGWFYVSSGGTANSTTVNSGGCVFVSSGGVLEGELLLGGKMTTYGEVTATDAKIVYDLTQRLPEEEIIVVNLAALLGASYTISVLSNQADGVYRLAGNAASFKNNVTLTVDGTGSSGVFTWQGDKYNSLSLNGRQYALVHNNSELCLEVGPAEPPKMSIDFSIDQVKQIVYSYGAFMEQFSDIAVLKIPYVATAQITMDKAIADGDYSFTACLNDYPGATKDFQIRINNGNPEYLSSNYACQATKIGETGETVTWQINSIEDYILTGLANAKMPIVIRQKDNESALEQSNTQLEVTCSGNVAVTVNRGLCDANKQGYYEQRNHCWIATAANMLYKCGYLPSGYSAQKCFEDLSSYYFDKSKSSNNQFGASNSGFEWQVFNDLGLKWQEDYRIYSIPESIYKGLQNLYLNKKGVENVAALSYRTGQQEDGKEINHVITCHSVKKLTESSATILYADSDDGINGEKLAKLSLFNKKWFIKFDGDDTFHELIGFTTLIGRTEGTPTLNMQKFIRSPISSKVSASQSSNVSVNGEATVVSESITDVVVEEKGILEITSGAAADTLYIHDNASVIFASGAKVTGKILSYGGSISVASGVDVAEAEIDFNLTSLQPDNETILDNLYNAQAASFTVTVGKDQATGRYVLGTGASEFDQNITLYGETYGDYSVRPGFVDGEMGTLSVGETLEVANQQYTLSVEGDTLALTVAWASCRVLSVDSDTSCLTIEPVTVTAVFSEDIVRPEYSYDGEHWQKYADGVNMTDNGFVWFRGTDAKGKHSEIVRHEVSNIIHYSSIDGGTENGLDLPESPSCQLLEFSNDGYNHSLKIEVESNRLNLYGLPSGEYCWRVREIYDVEWALGNDIIAEHHQETQLLQASNDGNMDAFFVNVSGTWSATSYAQHVGVGNWIGTEQVISLAGKNVIADIFAGSDDASLLLLTDDDNGDALFVDDIYSAFPDGLDAQARIAKIDEIRAGAGNDIVDLTSQRFEYIGDGLTVHGGLGNDVIWANNGDNWLFGDAGDDRLVGASGNDVLVGGAGDDTMHGGGGNDLFVFGNDWGKDTVEQLAGGKVTLWFASGDESKWNDETLTYTDGDNSVKVIGVAKEDITRYFGEEDEMYADLLAAGAFDDFTSERIFEDRNRGLLA